jgi:hypothetical protein
MIRGETRPPAQSRARATYLSDVSVALLLSASESAAAPASPIWLSFRLLRGEEGQGCSWRDRATGTVPGGTYSIDVSVALLLSASDSAAAPASPIWLSHRLQRREEGQECSWRDRPADTEQGARTYTSVVSKLNAFASLSLLLPLLSS